MWRIQPPADSSQLPYSTRDSAQVLQEAIRQNNTITSHLMGMHHTDAAVAISHYIKMFVEVAKYLSIGIKEFEHICQSFLLAYRSHTAFQQFMPVLIHTKEGKSCSYFARPSSTAGKSGDF